MNKRNKHTQTTIDQAKDTGMAMVLICLIAGILADRPFAYPVAVVLLLLTMTFPAVFKLPAKAWFGLSFFLGTIVSKILLTLVFFILVFPMGLLRRATGKDTLKLSAFKKDSASVFKTRDHVYQPADIEHPY